MAAGVGIELRAAKSRPVGTDSLPARLEDGLGVGGKILAERVQAAARARLPKSGGLAARVAAIAPEVNASRSGDDAKLSISHPAGRINAGTVTHPVFGREDIDPVEQEVQPGFVTDTLKAASDLMRAELAKAAAEHARHL